MARTLTLLSAFLVGSGVATSRTFTFKNQCSYSVWLGFAGGAEQNRQKSGTQCGGDGDCFEGTSCIQTGPIRQCFWNNPAPADGNYEVAPNGGTKDVQIPMNDNGYHIVWSGAVTGRTGCDSASGRCDRADCGNGGEGCIPSRGFEQPATQAEFTLQTDVDFYDVEIINGISIPIQMNPSNTPHGGSGNPYFCGNPGSFNPDATLGKCSWDFSPPSEDYNWVTAGGNACQSTSQCSTGICGISFNPGHADLLQKTCGNSLGFWTADQICGITPTYGAPFNCNDQLPDNLRMYNLLGCTGGIGSCYADGAQSNCCGCVDWDTEGIVVPGPEFTHQCKNSNPNWVSRVKPTLKWLKEGCPTAYLYPYDDATATFTCQNVQNGQPNTVNYEVTFCPEQSNETLSAPETFLRWFNAKI